MFKKNFKCFLFLIRINKRQPYYIQYILNYSFNRVLGIRRHFTFWPAFPYPNLSYFLIVLEKSKKTFGYKNNVIKWQKYLKTSFVGYTISTPNTYFYLQFKWIDTYLVVKLLMMDHKFLRRSPIRKWSFMLRNCIKRWVKSWWKFRKETFDGIFSVCY